MSYVLVPGGGSGMAKMKLGLGAVPQWGPQAKALVGMWGADFEPVLRHTDDYTNQFNTNHTTVLRPFQYEMKEQELSSR